MVMKRVEIIFFLLSSFSSSNVSNMLFLWLDHYSLVAMESMVNKKNAFLYKFCSSNMMNDENFKLCWVKWMEIRDIFSCTIVWLHEHTHCALVKISVKNGVPLRMLQEFHGIEWIFQVEFVSLTCFVALFPVNFKFRINFNFFCIYLQLQMRKCLIYICLLNGLLLQMVCSWKSWTFFPFIWSFVFLSIESFFFDINCPVEWAINLNCLDGRKEWEKCSRKSMMKRFYLKERKSYPNFSSNHFSIFRNFTINCSNNSDFYLNLFQVKQLHEFKLIFMKIWEKIETWKWMFLLS